MKRYVAFPSAFKRIPLSLSHTLTQQTGYKILYHAEESGLYLLEADQETITILREIYDEFYIFMEDF